MGIYIDLRNKGDGGAGELPIILPQEIIDNTNRNKSIDSRIQKCRTTVVPRGKRIYRFYNPFPRMIEQGNLIGFARYTISPLMILK